MNDEKPNDQRTIDGVLGKFNASPAGVKLAEAYEQSKGLPSFGQTQREREACFGALRSEASRHERHAVRNALRALLALYGEGPKVPA